MAAYNYQQSSWISHSVDIATVHNLHTRHSFHGTLIQSYQFGQKIPFTQSKNYERVWGSHIPQFATLTRPGVSLRRNRGASLPRLLTSQV